MIKKLLVLSLFFLLGCVVPFHKQLPLLTPGMAKNNVDEILQDSGKWLGPISTEEGMRNTWGYPAESFRLNEVLNQNISKRYYLYFDKDKFIKYSDSFIPYTTSPGIKTPAGQNSPRGISGGGRGMPTGGGAPMVITPGSMAEPEPTNS